MDEITEMIEKYSKNTEPISPQKMKEAMESLAASYDEEKNADDWITRYLTLPSYVLDTVRDGSDEYFNALKEAILAITIGKYGSIDYKGYKIFYTDSPHIKSISAEDGHKEYSYQASFQCEALSCYYSEDYGSEEERKAFFDPGSETFKKTLDMLDGEIRLLEEGKWIKERKKLDLCDFKNYSPERRRFKKIKWDERTNEASDTLSFLIEDAFLRTKDIEYTEADYDLFADIIRKMVFFADYGKKNYLFELEGLILFEWKPKTKADQYIMRCMKEFGQGDLPDNLLDNCSIYYFLEDPHGWTSVAYLLPIIALLVMCQDYDPDHVKDEMLRVFDLIPRRRYREKIEILIEEDRARANRRI